MFYKVDSGWIIGVVELSEEGHKIVNKFLDDAKKSTGERPKYILGNEPFETYEKAAESVKTEVFK